jgi:uncharacterized protein YfbU (UPF0304 family)
MLSDEERVRLEGIATRRGLTASDILRTYIRDVSGGDVALTRLERQILINQFETLKALTKSPHDIEVYDEKIEILRCGYEVFYSEAFSGTYPDAEVLPAEDGEFVIDVLSMYSAIHFHLAKHPDKDIQKMRYSHFEGFDGNNETSHMAFARFLLLKQHKWSELLTYAKDNDNFNSHSQNVPTYRRMLVKWNSFDHPYRYELTRERLVAVLDTVQSRG